jgi:hypothetical protein
MGGEGEEGERGARKLSYHIKVKGGREQKHSQLFQTLNPPSINFPPGLSFAFLLAACETLL